MKTRNEAREIERALDRAVDDAIELMGDHEALATLGDAICELGYAHLAPEDHAIRGYLLGLNEARNIVKRDHLRRPRRRIKR